uniref:Uncharacterized protein n=1 Tax=Magallana gigas TaxID=29159 RepID=K1R049_MAGGI
MGKIQPAHELAWFLCVMGSSGNQASTRLSESGSEFRAKCTHKFRGAESVKSKHKSACPRRPLFAQPLRPRDQFPANTAFYITIRHINMLSGS